MNSNPYFIERMMNDKISALRDQGMRSQSLTRAGLKGNEIHLPDLWLAFRRMVGQTKLILNAANELSLRNLGRKQEARNEKKPTGWIG